MDLIGLIRLAAKYDEKQQYEYSDAIMREVLAYTNFVNQNPSIQYTLRPWDQHAQEFEDADKQRHKLQQSFIPSYGDGMASAPNPFSEKQKTPLGITVSEQAKSAISKLDGRPIYLYVNLRGFSGGKPVLETKISEKPFDAQSINADGITVQYSDGAKDYMNGVVDWKNGTLVFTSSVPSKLQVQNDKEVDENTTTLFNMGDSDGVNGPAYVVHDDHSIGMNGGKTEPFEFGKDKTQGIGSYRNNIP